MYEVEGKEYRKIEIKRSHNTLFLSISYEDGKARNIVSNDTNKATTLLLYYLLNTVQMKRST
jgi:hypothetical protein